MKQRLFAWSGLLFCLLLVTACAGGASQKSSATHQATSQTNEELYILSNSRTDQHIFALPLRTVQTAARLTLPAGLTDLKHRRLYVATPLTTGNSTTISIIDTSSGATIRTFNIPGRYSTADRGYADSMLSADGHWLALRAQNAPAGTTDIALGDTQTGKLVKTVHLNGDFTLDAISPEGTILYLLEYYQVGTSHYNVRAYDVNASQLLEGSIVDKNDLGDKMQGLALTRQVSNDGDMAYTLYINPVANKAFIHILWLTDTTNGSVPFPAIARCLDLPVGNSPDLLHYYTLTLSQDGKMLYAANAALGTIAAVNLDLGPNSYQLWEIGNAKINHFHVDDSNVTSADKTREIHNGAALSQDQSLLYVVGLHGIRVIKTSTLQAQSEYLKQQDFTGLGISGDGKTLYGVDPSSGITLLDSNNGNMRSVINSVSLSPWGIEWSTG